MAKLGDIASVITKGTTPTSVGFDFADDGINFIKIESISETGEFIPEKFAHIDSSCHEKLKRSQLAENDILCSIAGAIGRVAIVNKNVLPANTNQALAIIRIPNGIVDYSFLAYVLQSPALLEQFESQKQGVAQLNLSLKNIGDLVIPNFSVKKQRSIAAVLDKVSDLIALRKQQLDKLDELVKARFAEMFGDPILNNKHFKTVAGKNYFKLSNGKAIPDKKRKASGIPAYGGNGISWYTDKALYDNDTLVIGRVGFQSGNVHFVKGPLWVTDNAMYISNFFVSEYDLIFLYALMDCIDFTRFQDAGDLKKITQKPFMQMEFIFPPLELQHRFSIFAAQVEKIKLTIQRGLDKLEMLKKALMQQYFG